MTSFHAGTPNTLKALLAAVTGAALVGFNPGWAGAVDTTVDAALQHGAADIRKFGVVGDGSDESAEVQAALNNAAIQKFYFPTGTYGVDNVTVPAGTSIVGDGPDKTQFKHLNGTDSGVKMISGGTIRDCAIDCNFAAALGSDFAGFEFGGDRLLVDNFYVLNVSRFGIRMRDYKHATLRKIYCSEAAGHGGVAGQAQHLIYNVGGLTNANSVFIADDIFLTDTLNATPEKGPGGLFISQAAATAYVIINKVRANNIGMNTATNLSAAVDLYTDADNSIVTDVIVSNYIYQGVKLQAASDLVVSDIQVLGAVDASQGTALSIQPNARTAAGKGGGTVTNVIIRGAGSTGMSVLSNITDGVAPDYQLDNILIEGGADRGLYLSYISDWSLNNVRSKNNGGHGIETEFSGGTCTATGVVTTGNTGDGWYTEDEDGGAELTMTGCSSNSNAGGIQLMLRDFKVLNFNGNTVDDATAGTTGVDIQGITDHLGLFANVVRCSGAGASDWAVNIAATAAGEFWCDATYPWSNVGTPSGVITGAFAGQLIRNSSTAHMYMCRTAGGTTWTQVT